MTVVFTGPVERHGHRTTYEHLTPLFAEYGRLAPDDPRRARLRDELIAGHLPVARHIARKYVHRGENPDDVEQVATLGLILAVDRFEYDRGFDFLSFAVPTVTGEVLRYFRDRSTSIRVPRRLRELQSSIHDAAADLGQSLGRAPRPSEIAALLDVDVEVVLTGLAAQGAGHCSSLDEPAWNHEGDAGSRMRFGGAMGRAEREFDLVEHRETLAPLLAALPERERTIVLLRFVGELTQTEIGQQIGVSQMHVSRLLTRTLSTLRRKLAVE